MPRSVWGTWGRAVAAAATVSLASLFQCTLFFDLGGLDTGSKGGEAGSGANEGSAAGDAPAEVAIDGTSVPVAGDASDAADAIDVNERAQSDAFDATADADASVADGDGGCVTSFSGDTTRDTTQVLFAFNTQDVPGWVTGTNSGGPSAILGWTAKDGHTCPGALTMTVGFKAYDGNSASMQFTYGPGASWQGTRLHAWVKLVSRSDGGSADYMALSGAELFVLSNNWGNFSFVLENVNPSFGDGGWHEIVLDFGTDGGHTGRSGPDVVTASIQQVGFTISPGTSRPVGGPATPPTILVLLDDVWLE